MIRSARYEFLKVPSENNTFLLFSFNCNIAMASYPHNLKVTIILEKDAPNLICCNLAHSASFCYKRKANLKKTIALGLMVFFGSLPLLGF